MRVIQYYKFWIGQKVPFPEWPDLVKRFMQRSNLHYGAFRYHFKTGLSGAKAALKDCPALAPAGFAGSPDSLKHLTNLEDGRGCGEEELLTLMPKIYRRYGFMHSTLIYRDVDFFARLLPTERIKPGDAPSCFIGSQIVLNRDSVFPTENNIELFIDLYHDGVVLDPAPYREAMKQLLPDIWHKPLDYMKCFFTHEEQQALDVLNKTASPLILMIEGDFRSRLLPIGKPKTDGTPVKLNLLSDVKKLCSRNGMIYDGYDAGVYDLHRRTERGHYIIGHITVSGWNQIVDFEARFAGLGFSHRLFFSRCIPESKEQATLHLTRCFDTLSEAVQNTLPALDAHYPPTPDWFVPHGY